MTRTGSRSLRLATDRRSPLIFCQFRALPSTCRCRLNGDSNDIARSGVERKARGGGHKPVRSGGRTAPREGTDERCIERGRLDVTAEAIITKVHYVSITTVTYFS